MGREPDARGLVCRACAEFPRRSSTHHSHCIGRSHALDDDDRAVVGELAGERAAVLDARRCAISAAGLLQRRARATASSRSTP